MRVRSGPERPGRPADRLLLPFRAQVPISAQLLPVERQFGFLSFSYRATGRPPPLRFATGQRRPEPRKAGGAAGQEQPALIQLDGDQLILLQCTATAR